MTELLFPFPFDALGSVAFAGVWRLVLLAFLFGAAAHDVKTRLVSAKLLLALCASWALLCAVALVVKGPALAASVALEGLVGSAAIGAFAFASALAMDKLTGAASFGGGDIKLLAACGLYMGAFNSLVLLAGACMVALLIYVMRMGAYGLMLMGAAMQDYARRQFPDFFFKCRKFHIDYAAMQRTFAKPGKDFPFVPSICAAAVLMCALSL